MEVLLDVQLQLSHVVADVTLRSQANGFSSSPVAMTPVLINIEQLLDDIRAATRLIVANASTHRVTEPPRATPMEIDDFRIKLESEDVVDYESETETENENEESEDERNENIGVKRHREEEEVETDEEPDTKRQESAIYNEADSKSAKLVKEYLESAKSCSILDIDVELTTLQKKITHLAGLTTRSMLQMVRSLQAGKNPSVNIATDFRDATVLLPKIVTRHHERRNMSSKWLTTTTKSIGQILAFGKKRPEVPKCLSDPRLVYTQGTLSKMDGFARSPPNLLDNMEKLIKHLSDIGVLEPDRMEGPLGKLASIFRKYFTSLKSPNTPVPTEQDWSRFTTIANVLTDWIHLAQQAKTPPKLRPPLAGFERQLKGFKKVNPGRIPDSLLQYVIL
ncbi:hypothetical protein PHMEG_00018831 [Phytophthora megakarya]|uniref:Uncharacterized protein n=1 Tax=Phytophthora megakarya TaxID=4795 RepID=A0A225VT22_9STRA|nr:hypothetical protein PHMEG_00018831 [Phytophthora megakarya]